MSREDPGDLETYQRLIGLQKQIIELVERNAAAERECIQLREQLARETAELYRSTHSLWFRLRRAGARWLKRWRSDSRLEPPGVYRPDLKLLPSPRCHAQNH